MTAGLVAWVLAGACLAGACLVLACLVLARQRRHARDAARLCLAIDRFGSSDTPVRPEDLTRDLPQGALHDVAQASEKLLGRIASQITTLEWAARHDPMTDLLNSAAFKLACQTWLASGDSEAGDSEAGDSEAGDSGPHGALLIMGICEFKKVNDSLGHAGGDQLLCAVADRLRLVAGTLCDPRGGGTACDCTNAPLVGRLGGDEFALFLAGRLSHAEIERFIHRLQRVIGEACHVGPQSLRVKLSVGIAFAGEHGAAYDQILAAADTAMYAAKAEGLGEYCFYTPAMRSAADDLLAKELALRTALEQGQFCLHYQPQLCLATGRIEGVEALIRWKHPTQGLIYPNDFIPFAETHGLIDDIGDWVILEAIRTAARWAHEGHPLKMSINISPKQLWRVELIPMIRACLARFELAPRLLEIEITEAAIMRNEEFSLERIEGLRRDGVTVALDDFGTGYSNLAQLMALPMDRLKLDKSLIDTIVTDPRRQVIVTTMIHMARELGFEVVAEGVEDLAQFNLLRAAGCGQIQGYFISRPVPEAELFALIAAFREIPEHRVA